MLATCNVYRLPRSQTRIRVAFHVVTSAWLHLTGKKTPGGAGTHILPVHEPTLTKGHKAQCYAPFRVRRFYSSSAMPMASAHADCCYSGLYAIDLGSWYFDGGVAPRPRSRVDRPLAPSWALGIPYSSTPPMLRLMTG